MKTLIDLISVRNLHWTSLCRFRTSLNDQRGHWRTENIAVLLEELFRKDGCAGMGGRHHGPAEDQRMPRCLAGPVERRGKFLSMIMVTANASVETDGGKPPDLCQQKRCTIRNDRAGSDTGTWERVF